ncbi:MAG: DUF192 domain-containing protein [bacterium]|nr:DUF192 domain-containing protein [bacterium]
MKKISSDMNARIGAVVVLVLGVAISGMIAIWGVPTFWKKSDTKTPATAEELRDLDQVTIDLSQLDLEIVDTDPLRKQGLSGRASLGENAGMLFVFPSSERHGFWMKDMNFPLDIIWISDGVVVDVVTLSPPYPGLPIPPSHRPKANADIVLELNAGKAEELGIKEGVRLTF